VDRPARRTSLWTGAFLGAIAAVALVALGFLAHRAFGVPFAPYDVFEWTSRWLPGSVVTAGIETLVTVISALGIHPTARAAKAAEESLAIMLFLAGSAALGALVVAAGRAAPRRPPLLLGLAAGAVWSAVVLQSERALGEATAKGVAWVVFVHLAWGAAVGWSIHALESAPGDDRAVRAARRSLLMKLAAGVAGASALLVTIAGRIRRGRPVAAPGIAEPQRGPRARAVPGTRPEITPNDAFYRIDIDLEPPRIDASTWRLRVEGMVDSPLSLTLDEVRALPAVSQMITLECISNRLGGDLIGTSRWTGARLSDVLRAAAARDGAEAVLIHAADGYYESVSMADAHDERMLLVYEMNGEPLAPAHGFPLRIYVPNRHGMKLPKWIERLRVSDRPGPGSWVDRGWSKEAVPHTTSVIDTVGMSMMLGTAAVLPVGGIAYAGARGISRVEVQVDDGPWAEAQLLEPPLGPLTWVLWRYDWPYGPGKHTFRVRAYDGQGVLQPVEERPPHPDGASGVHEMTLRV
jgi:DMSO/TMAO reductase YedYZ molybdopterin-dependent catalytic subunit